ncbi:Hypothetical predicted protein [Octopus vulgaris]|uniref:Uncharacterized protein n=1 Tax=Octopus vulgaris TaxID=6645 RepID=A0AA36BGR9_OCTVU|nr:Hypothetical predicted protein [Octopus vulgaris]
MAAINSLDTIRMLKNRIPGEKRTSFAMQEFSASKIDQDVPRHAINLTTEVDVKMDTGIFTCLFSQEIGELV